MTVENMRAVCGALGLDLPGPGAPDGSLPAWARAAVALREAIRDAWLCHLDSPLDLKARVTFLAAGVGALVAIVILGASYPIDDATCMVTPAYTFLPGSPACIRIKEWVREIYVQMALAPIYFSLPTIFLMATTKVSMQLMKRQSMVARGLFMTIVIAVVFGTWILTYDYLVGTPALQAGYTLQAKVALVDGFLARNIPDVDALHRARERDVLPNLCGAIRVPEADCASSWKGS